MFRHTDPEVLVVGAGPVGLIAALFLQLHGVRVEVIDEDQRTTQHSYALAIHPRTLRILDEAGLAQKLIAAGRKLTKVAYYEGQREARRDRLFIPRFQASVSPHRSSKRAGERRGRGAPRGEAQGPLGTSTPSPQRKRRDSGGGREARSRGGRLSCRAKRVGRRAKRDDPAVVCDRCRRLRLGRAADVGHRDGRAWRGRTLLRL